jgi:tetratricopeptide (TPR) repeat protein
MKMAWTSWPWMPRLSIPEGWRSLRALVVLVAVVVVLAAAGVGAWLWSSSRTSAAMAAYAVALARVHDTRGAPPSPEARSAAIQTLETTLSTYPSAPAAGNAAYELGNLRYAGGDFPRARAAYQIAVGQSPSPTLRTMARAGIGYAWEAEKNYASASQAYRDALGPLKPTDFHFEELLVDLGRVQELAGQRDDAIATYRRILKDVPKSLRADDVRGRLAALGATP